MTLIDSDQRSQATNPGLSFIVQAPAGSGKTEILTQRYLRLLGTVTAPEQIIALTFTRKAASEMRERIILALQQAAAKQPATSAHQQKALDYAKDALARSEQLSWDLLLQANRLKIITIDALCQSINQAIPLLEKQIAYCQITDKPNNHYLNAARLCIQFALQTPEYQQAIKTLLLHVDNRQDRLLGLFTALLSQRDQWLKPLFQARAQEQSIFEHALSLIEQHELKRFIQSLPMGLAAELTRLSRELALIENNPDSPRYPLRDWYEFKYCNQDLAKALSKLLLTGEGTFRSAFDHHVGLKRGVCSDSEYEQLRASSKELLQQLNNHPDFLAALIQVSQLPPPVYDPEQWQVLQALFAILPLLVGHLHLCFSEHNEVDFNAIAQQALSALGDAEAPTDLALYLDNAIHHLLVDEFQDTSISQFELLNKLVQGWQPGDGKTLFLVGDPMQSIYRFRQAEVGLFFRAKEQGIGPVKLQSLQLSCNFRSTHELVTWVNNQFSNIFPQQFDIESGAVSFHPSSHPKEACHPRPICHPREGGDPTNITANDFNTKEQEAQHLIACITKELQRDTQQTLAILVRSRTQLTEIIRLLRQNQIPYQGTDIDLLANLPHLRDVWSLTQALLSPANRLAWLSVLHSPYCGLSLADLHAIACFNTKKSIYLSLLQMDQIQGISEEGKARAGYCIQVLHKALNQRYQSGLSNWVSQTLKELHVDRILNQSQQEDLAQFWALLDRFEEEARLPDIKEFIHEFSKLYSQQANPSRLQVMTIHKSKGLEFDTVFLPGLGSQPNRGDKPMLRWLKLPTQKHGDLLLVSPIQAAHQDNCDLYDYLGRLDDEKSSYEAQRLLYVAVTRAKERLYLFNSSSKSSKGSFKNMLKYQEFTAQEQPEAEEDLVYPLPHLQRLPLSFYNNSTVSTNRYLNPISTGLKPGIPRITGIVAHQILQWICDKHPQSPKEVPWNLARYEFKKAGFDETTQATAMETLQEQIHNLFEDPRGIWIIKPHDQEHNEYELLVEHQGRVVTRIIDRTFVEDDTLWIIDFKTGKADEEAVANHRLQLEEYAYYLSARGGLGIQCGLYYLESCSWISWDYSISAIALKPNLHTL